MWSAARARRCVFMVHRWTGVAMCLVIALWVVSGVVMLFMGYPKLLPTERLGALPALPTHDCCVPVEAALRHSPAPEAVQRITLTTIAGRPSYRVTEGDGSLQVVDAVTGLVAPRVDGAAALRSARAFLPGADGVVRGMTHDDRWTHSGLLDPHRPLFQVRMRDAANTWVYVSSSTGEVVMDAPSSQRHWNFAGAWLHWVYMFRDGSRDPVWSWLVIGLSAVATLSALAGALVGVWRWRFSGRYRSGAKTPYREFHMRWHHMTGLVFGTAMVLWLFSGVMSMNPVGLFDPVQRPDLQAYRNGTPGSTRLALGAREALALLRSHGFDPRELEWRVLGGAPYLLASDAKAHTRIVGKDDAQHPGGLPHRVLERFPTKDLERLARPLLPARIAAADVLDRHDTYYVRRGAASMYAAAERDVPVLRLRFDDPGRTLVYISPSTGDVVLSADRAQRAGRWLFNLLHSWDLPWMLRQPVFRDIVLTLLSMGAMAIALTGIVLGLRRCVRSLRPGLHQPAAARAGTGT